MAYYADKNGKPTKEGKDWVAKSKKEKIKKMRDLADNLKPEEKEKVTNSDVAKKLERSGILNSISGAVGIGAGISAGIAANNISKIDSRSIEGTVKNDVTFNDGGGYRDANGNWVKTDVTVPGKEIKFGEKGTYGTGNEILHTEIPDSSYTNVFVSNNGKKELIYRQGGTSSAVTVGAKISSSVMSLLGALTGQLWLVMVGSLIIGGLNSASGVKSLHKANVMRREEILQQLMQSKKKE